MLFQSERSVEMLSWTPELIIYSKAELEKMPLALRFRFNLELQSPLGVSLLY
jgi:hypothetical protein